MKKTLLIIFTMLFTFSEINAQISLPYYEGFDYTEGESLVSGSGNLGDWLSTYSSNTNGDPVVVASPTWSLPAGLPAATGKAVQFNGGSDDPVLTFAPQGDTGFLYSSFVFRITDLSVVTTTSGGFIYSFAKVNSNSNGWNYTSAVYVKKNGTGASTTFKLGISENNNTNNAAWSPTDYDINTDYFVVISYDIANEVSHMWINPASVSSATEPSPDLSTVDTATGSRDDIVVVRLSLESNANTPNTTFDEIRIGKTWASVVTNPPTASVKDDEFSNYFSLYPNPASGFINIQSKSVEVINVEMFNLTGQRVLEQKGLVKNGVDVSALSKGIYILKLSSADNQFSRKIVVE